MNKDLEFIDINLDDKTSSKSSRFGTHKNTGTHFSDDSHDNIEKEYTDETDKSDADITNLPPSSDNPGKRKSHMLIREILSFYYSNVCQQLSYCQRTDPIRFHDTDNHRRQQNYRKQARLH